jgi:signal transduction histidine kinase
LSLLENRIGTVDSNQLELHRQSVSVTDLTSEAIAGLRHYDPGNKVIIKPQIEWAGTLDVDRDRIVQVLFMLANAIKFSPTGASVELIVTQKECGQIRFSVNDHGPGIPVEGQSQLFQRFHQVRTTDALTKSRAGLGLYISKAIIEKHGGTIGCCSAVGTGVCFWFELPEQS